MSLTSPYSAILGIKGMQYSLRNQRQMTQTLAAKQVPTCARLLGRQMSLASFASSSQRHRGRPFGCGVKIHYGRHVCNLHQVRQGFAYRAINKTLPSYQRSLIYLRPAVPLSRYPLPASNVFLARTACSNATNFLLRTDAYFSYGGRHE